MKAAVLHQPGNAENFKLEERSIPKPNNDQILIRIKAFGLNRSELMTRKGWSPDVKFPRVLGIECVGVVENDPAGEYAKGQQIAALMGGMGREFDGSYAEYAVVPKRITYPFNSKLSWEVLGAIPEMFQTVYGSLFKSLDIQKGESIVIRGGTSSIGMLAAQMAKNAGLTVLSTTRKPQKKSKLLESGSAYALIDDGALVDRVKEIYPQGADKLLELVGTPTLQDSLMCVKTGGTVCMTGMLSGKWTLDEFAPMDFIPSTVKLTVFDSGQTRSTSRGFQDFLNEVEAGKIKIEPSRVFSLNEIVEAHRLMEDNRADGKIVVLT